MGGRLIRTHLPWVNATPKTFELLKNPFWNEEQPGALQSTGWYKAWTAVASPYAVRAQSTADIVAAVNFARDNDVKLVVKGTGHDYLGRNCAPRSLLVWTHDMRTITLHDAFLPKGAPAGTTPVEEGVANAFRHGAATEVEIRMQAQSHAHGRAIWILIDDNGHAESGHRSSAGLGTRLLDAAAPDDWTLGPGPAGGMRLSVVVPVGQGAI